MEFADKVSRMKDVVRKLTLAQVTLLGSFPYQKCEAPGR